MSAKLPILVLVVIAAMTAVSFATTIVVNGDGSGAHTLIQDGINRASEGDTVLVMPGIYEGTGNTWLNLGGTDIVLRSSGGAGSTTIDCGSLTQGFYFCGLETASCVVEGFTITNGASADGAGMYFIGSSPTIRDCVFNRNIASDHGGGIFCSTAAYPTFTGCTLSNNQANWGAGVGCQLGTVPAFENCTFADNVAVSGGGGAWLDSSSPSFMSCFFEGNSVSTIYMTGGGMYIKGGSAPTLIDCSFTDNTVSGVGGGVDIIDASSPSFTACTFARNSADGGGGVDMYDAVNASFDHCWFFDNTATYDGGAVYSSGGSVPTFTECTVVGNAAGYEGGAMYFYDFSTPVLANCTLYDNSAPVGSGVWCDDNFELTNCIIAFGVVGEAVFCAGDPPYVTCSDIYGNAGGDWVGCLAGMDGADNNLHADPLFCDAPGGDFTLDIPSPCTAANAPACGLVGAWDIGCDSPVQAESWGAIKAMYR